MGSHTQKKQKKKKVPHQWVQYLLVPVACCCRSNTSWWFQPIWKNMSQKWKSSPIFGVKHPKNLWVATTQVSSGSDTPNPLIKQTQGAVTGAACTNDCNSSWFPKATATAIFSKAPGGVKNFTAFLKVTRMFLETLKKCWWFRNPAKQLRLVVHPIISISGGAEFLPSTVSVTVSACGPEVHTP